MIIVVEIVLENYTFVVVLWVVFMPLPILRVIVIVVEVNVAILQLCQHVGTYLEQLVITHAIVYTRLVNSVYRIPVDVFVIEVTIVLVTDFP
jgi:hypothetical protein